MKNLTFFTFIIVNLASGSSYASKEFVTCKDTDVLGAQNLVAEYFGLRDSLTKKPFHFVSNKYWDAAERKMNQLSTGQQIHSLRMSILNDLYHVDNLGEATEFDYHCVNDEKILITYFLPSLFDGNTDRWYQLAVKENGNWKFEVKLASSSPDLPVESGLEMLDIDYIDYYENWIFQLGDKD